MCVCVCAIYKHKLFLHTQPIITNFLPVDMEGVGLDLLGCVVHVRRVCAVRYVACLCGGSTVEALYSRHHIMLAVEDLVQDMGEWPFFRGCFITI